MVVSGQHSTALTDLTVQILKRFTWQWPHNTCIIVPREGSWNFDSCRATFPLNTQRHPHTHICSYTHKSQFMKRLSFKPLVLRCCQQTHKNTHTHTPALTHTRARSRKEWTLLESCIRPPCMLASNPDINWWPT